MSDSFFYEISKRCTDKVLVIDISVINICFEFRYSSFGFACL